MGILSGLPGTGDKVFKIKEFGRSVSHMMRLYRKHRFATASGENGSINIWKDDKGKHRAERDRYKINMGELETSSLNVLQGWLKRNYPKIK